MAGERNPPSRRSPSWPLRTRARQAEVELRGRIQQICLEHRLYGSRRVSAVLRGEGLPVCRKRVQRLMRMDNLLALRKRRYVITTESRHTYFVFRNLAADVEATAANQLWVADITYIRLRESFVYLAVILDAWSRRVVGWELGETLEAELATAALRRALAGRSLPEGAIHHSDRGVQYCSDAYVKLLREAGLAISMSRAGNPYDKDYASHCTSSVRSDMSAGNRCRSLNFPCSPCILRGGSPPGSSYRHSCLSLYSWALNRPYLFQTFTQLFETPSNFATS